MHYLFTRCSGCIVLPFKRTQGLTPVLIFPLQQYTAVPQTPLLTSQVLKEENEQWPEVQQEMSMALKEMRVDPDQNFTVKTPGSSNSSLAKKRRNKTAANTVPSTIDEQISTE